MQDCLACLKSSHSWQQGADHNGASTDTLTTSVTP